MPVPPDYAALTRGQIALLDRINAGDTGLAVLNQVVQLATAVLGGAGGSFTEFAADHGRIVAATGECSRTLGRRVSRTEFTRSGVACELNGVAVGRLHVCGIDLAPEQRTVLELLSATIAQLYAARAGLPVHTDGPQPVSRLRAEVSDRDGLVEHWKRRHEDRDLFVAVTSHELRTPVTVIKGYADTLTNHWQTLGEDGRREAARVIGARAGELARLVDRLLSATSEESGDAPPGPFDLVDALRSAAAGLPEDLRSRLVLADLPGDLPKAYGDRDAIATVLTELATNAEKYSPPGTEVTVSASCDETTVTFQVADRGYGVRPEHVELAFERYWQGEPASGGRNPGAGLGLYLVRRTVERRNGWVSLRPRPGGGTIAEVRFPRA
ncbi:sensor histidine kinase [Actinoplanes sp. RD1]|uniref:sensor histidine kinase n=1 Tax=Actinoplanes sp. RD1 TaxID=3064538 RepID=UPI0027419557|nr:HAMP domain-containing sensor histidine kinase [Actinoplanes sp. RD1]